MWNQSIEREISVFNSHNNWQSKYLLHEVYTVNATKKKEKKRKTKFHDL